LYAELDGNREDHICYTISHSNSFQDGSRRTKTPSCEFPICVPMCSLSNSPQTQTQEESSEEDEEPRRATQKNGRRAAQSEDETEEDEEEEEGEEEMEVDPDADSQDQVVKKLVRYALACEYQRISIKRTGITEKGQHIPTD
jgi:hypothetical protein